MGISESLHGMKEAMVDPPPSCRCARRDLEGQPPSSSAGRRGGRGRLVLRRPHRLGKKQRRWRGRSGFTHALPLGWDYFSLRRPSGLVAEGRFAKTKSAQQKKQVSLQYISTICNLVVLFLKILTFSSQRLLPCSTTYPISLPFCQYQ